MKQRYSEYSHGLAWLAADACFAGKWTRRDVLAFVEKNTGISRREIWKGELDADLHARLEATDAVAYYIDEMMAQIMASEDPEDMEPVRIARRPDGMTGKVREIASLCIPHQLLGHVAVLMLKPLLDARILPSQHASIPGRGQTGLKRQAGRILRRKSLDIRFVVKTDAVHAYGTTMYREIVTMLEEEIPAAKELLQLLRYLASLAPGGHLIIGGYLDAWLFNLFMSYALRHVLAQGRIRRGRFLRDVIRTESYMDDVGLMSRTPSGLKRGMRAMAAWFAGHGMAIKQTSGIIPILSAEEERHRRKETRPARRGCPALDMGGYLIHRTYVTIRPRVVKRTIRAFRRAWEELKRTGTIQRQRAESLAGRYGPIQQTNSARFREKYHVREVMQTALHVQAFWARERARKERRRLEHAVYGNAGHAAA